MKTQKNTTTRHSNTTPKRYILSQLTVNIYVTKKKLWTDITRSDIFSLFSWSTLII